MCVGNTHYLQQYWLKIWGLAQHYIKNWENFFSVCVSQLALVNISAATIEDGHYTEGKVLEKKG
jgi:hypothetical protein